MKGLLLLSILIWASHAVAVECNIADIATGKCKPDVYECKCTYNYWQAGDPSGQECGSYKTTLTVWRWQLDQCQVNECLQGISCYPKQYESSEGSQDNRDFDKDGKPDGEDEEPLGNCGATCLEPSLPNSGPSENPSEQGGNDLTKGQRGAHGPESQCTAKGSILGVEDGNFIETVALIGTPFHLVYNNQYRGYSPEYKKEDSISIYSDATQSNKDVPLGFVSQKTRVQGWGNIDVVESNDDAKLSHYDVFGKAIGIPYEADISAAYHYEGRYTVVALDTPFGTIPDNGPIIESTYNPAFTRRFSSKYALGRLVAPKSWGGWSLSGYHFYDRQNKSIWMSTGDRIDVPWSKRESTSFASSLEFPYLVPDKGGQLAYAFDADGLHKETWDLIKGLRLEQFQHDENHQLVAHINKYGIKTKFVYKDGFLDRIESAANGVTQFRFEEGSLIEILLAGGGAYGFTYNLDRYDQENYLKLLEIRNPRGYAKSVAYNGGSNEETDAKGNRKLFGDGIFETYDVTSGQSRRLTHTRKEGYGNSSTSTHLDGFGLVDDKIAFARSSEEDNAAVELSNSAVLNQRYYADHPVLKPRRRLKEMIERRPSGLERRDVFNYSEIFGDTSNILSLENYRIEKMINEKASGAITYDRSQNSLTWESAEGQILRSVFNEHGDLSQVKLGNLAPKEYSYDARGRLTQIRQGARTVTYEYNSLDQLRSVTDEMNQTTYYEYDAAGSVTGIERPDGKRIVMTYDANGNRTSITNTSHQVTKFTFDEIDHLETRLEPTLADLSSKYTWSTDMNKNPITALEPDHEIRYDYTFDGSIKSIESGDKRFEFEYDKRSRLSRIISPEKNVDQTFYWDGDTLIFQSWHNESSMFGSVGYSYNDQFLLSSLRVKGNEAIDPIALDPATKDEWQPSYRLTGQNSTEIHYEYDDDQRLLKAGDLEITWQTNTPQIGHESLGNLRTDYEYNEYGELLSQEIFYKSQPVLKFEYEYRADGKISRVNEKSSNGDRIIVYDYNAIGELIEVVDSVYGSQKYSYDANGNRLGKGEVYDKQDRLMGNSEFDFSYEQNGDLKSRQSRKDGTRTDYKYDFRGNLIEFRQGDIELDYQWDAFSRRIIKKNGRNASEGLIYKDALNPVAKVVNGKPDQVYVYATKRHVPSYIIENHGDGVNRIKIIADHLGSPRLLIDADSGTILQRIDYDAWGKVVNTTDDKLNPGYQPFGFAGGIYDGDTKLLRFGARDYDPSIGRWLDKDPIRFESGQFNHYVYVGNDPVNYIDSDGLSPEDANRIRETQQSVVDRMISQGNRLPGSGTIAGWINNAASNFDSNIWGCGRQALEVKNDLGRFTNQFDDTWNFEMKRDPYIWPWNDAGHYTIEATSSNPNDPVLILDPWRGSVK